jgi:hypothetical protein
MTEFTPTTTQVRDGYRYDPEAEYRDPITPHHEINGRAFDRWLAAHDAAVERAAAVKALRPVADLLAPIIARIDGDRVGTHSVNCHEYHVQCLAVAVQRRIESGESA